MNKFQIRMKTDRNNLYKIFYYPAGEAQVRLLPKGIRGIKQHDTVEIVANIDDGDNVMELALLADAVSFVGHDKTRILVLPYLPYARADRRFDKGDCHGLGVFGKILNTMDFDSIETYDIHNPDRLDLIVGSYSHPVEHLINRAIRKIGSDNLCVLLPDEGSIKRYNLDKINVNYFFQGEKVRDAKTGALTGFEIPAKKMLTKFKKLLIIDDICDGGGTFIGLAEKIRKYSPKTKLYLYVTHGIFSRGYAELAQYFDHIFCTDSCLTPISAKGNKTTEHLRVNQKGGITKWNLTRFSI